MLKKLALGGLGILFLASTLVASPAMATTDPIAELRIRIAELQEQLAKLMVESNINIGHGAQGEPDYCHMPFTKNLMIGSTDARTDGEVTRLQQFLQSQGYAEARVTGYYGNITAGLVMRWQKAHGMDFVTLKSGVGPMTRAKINANCGIFSPGSQSSVISGEYEYSDMTGFSTFRTANGPFGTSAVIVERAKSRWPETDIPPGTMPGFSLHNAIVGTLNPLGDTCVLVIEASVEIANPEKAGLKDRQGYDIVSADFVRLVSKGRVFDNCQTFDSNNTMTKTQRF